MQCLKDAYHVWCKKKKFLSMLSNDVKERKCPDTLRQSSLNMHAVDHDNLPKAVRYSDAGFHRLCLEWGASTDQVMTYAHPALFLS